MCHIWKILPDLYEAIEEITKTQATASQPPTTIETPTATQPNAEGRIFSNCSFSSMTFVVSFLERENKIDAYARQRSVIGTRWNREGGEMLGYVALS